MKLVIIGGGAAGMMAAIAASECGAEVTVLERNVLCGAKLNLTGKGRCNVTNQCDIEQLIRSTPCNGKFLYSAFKSFTAEDTIQFFESIGVPLKTERGNRVFPQSDHAKDITHALRSAMSERGVRVQRCRAKAVTVADGAVTGVQTDSGFFPADAVILATGGRSYPRTGSDGDGYRMAQALGHTVIAQRPSLVPLRSNSDICPRLEGLSLRNVALCVEQENTTIYEDFGEMLFTANGVSGPMILSASAHLAQRDTFACLLHIDLKPALDRETLDKRVLRDFEEGKNRDFANVVGGLVPQKLIPVVIERCGIPPAQKVNAVTRAQREAFCLVLKDFTVPIHASGSFDEAVITAGGVDTKEISPKTMESKLVHGLYFAGELIDVDAYTGGFNLQIAWSTGHKAGQSAALQL